MGHVYFVQVGSKGDIKIGYSTNIKSRMHTLQTSIPEPIKLLGYITGDLEKEKEIHKMFRALRKKGEWFNYDKRIIEYLNEVNEMKTHINMKVHIEIDEEKGTTIYSKLKK